MHFWILIRGYLRKVLRCPCFGTNKYKVGIRRPKSRSTSKDILSEDPQNPSASGGGIDATFYPRAKHERQEVNAGSESSWDWFKARAVLTTGRDRVSPVSFPSSVCSSSCPSRKLAQEDVLLMLLVPCTYPLHMAPIPIFWHPPPFVCGSSLASRLICPQEQQAGNAENSGNRHPSITMGIPQQGEAPLDYSRALTMHFFMGCLLFFNSLSHSPARVFWHRLPRR